MTGSLSSEKHTGTTNFLKLVVTILPCCFRASLVSQMVENLPAMKETGVQYLGWADCLEKGMATHFRILAWKIPWTEGHGGYSSPGCKSLT